MKPLFLISLLLCCACADVHQPQHTTTSEFASSIAIDVDGMMCRNCEKAIAKAINALPGVHSVVASHLEKRVTVAFDKDIITLEAIKNEIAALGFEVK